MEGRLLTPLAPKPVPQLVPPRFRLDLHCSYHQGPGHDTDHCNALRHAIQDLIDQGLVNLGQPSVTTNPLPAHSTHAVPPPLGDIHHINLIEDDSIHMLSLDDGLPESIVLHDNFDSFYTFGYWMSGYLCPFTLWLEDDDSNGRDIQIVTHSGRIAQPPPPAVRPFEGTTSHEEVRREDDEVLRQLQSTQARISIWSLLASSSTHRDALIRALIQIRVKTTIIYEWGIEVVPNKIKAILDMLVPRIEKKIRGFLDMALGYMLAQIDDSRKERAIYYLMHLISRLDLLRYLFDRLALTGRLMRWLILLTDFDIQYVSRSLLRKMVHVLRWCSHQSGYGIGVMLVSPQGDHILRSVRLAFSERRPTTNNIVEYEACILGLETALEFCIKQMEVFGDSNLNWFADALATLTSSVDIPIDVVVRPLLIELRSTPTYYCLIGEVEVQDDLPCTYLEVATAKDRRALRQLATRFVICGDTLYRRSTDGIRATYRKWADHDFKNESGLHIESGQITAEAHPGAYGKKIKGDPITYQTRYDRILGKSPSKPHIMDFPYPRARRKKWK
ncbi:hypothetical protein AAG906_008907 [Vitis piasezkii]